MSGYKKYQNNDKTNVLQKTWDLISILECLLDCVQQKAKSAGKNSTKIQRLRRKVILKKEKFQTRNENKMHFY